MRKANAQVEVLREGICTDPYGRKIEGQCEYTNLGIICCVRMKQAGFDERLAGAIRAEENVDVYTFVYHSQDQETIIDVKTDDYLVVLRDGVPWYFLVKEAVGALAFRRKGVDRISYTILSSRIVPRECPRELVQIYTTDGIS